MCGIALILSYRPDSPPVDCDELLRIRDAMHRRGPDDAGIWISSSAKIAMGHRRLSIIDPGSDGHQPMSTDDGKLRLVFNGEIYNYKVLRSKLEKKGYRFRTQSDTEVLLHLYRDKGREMVHELRGMFAFAIWDEVEKGVLLARDHFGIKPLYYADNGYVIRVASQVKAILKGGGVSVAPEPAGYVGFHIWGCVPEPYTLYKNIRSLQAGCTLWIDFNGTKKLETYFSVSKEYELAEHFGSQHKNNNMHTELAAALNDSVSHHLIADVPLSIFLSSGLDSATLAALASECSGRKITTITLAFNEYKDTVDDEAPLAEAISRHYDTNHYTVWTDKSEFKNELYGFLSAMDQPSIDGLNGYFVSKAAVSKGQKVALSGVGGDELFAGYPSFMQIPKMVKGLKMTGRIPAIGRGFRWISAPVISKLTSPKYASLLEYGSTYSGAYLLRRGMYMPWELPKILDGELVREGWQELQTLVRLEETVGVIQGPRSKVSALELTWYMRNQLLRDADWSGMAHGLEIRTPLIDVTLFRKLLPYLVSDNPPTKRDMAVSPIRPLIREVLYRKKTGFTVPVMEWLQGEGSIGRPRGMRGWASKIVKENSVLVDS